MKTPRVSVFALTGVLTFVLAFARSVPAGGAQPSTWVQCNVSGFGDANNSTVLTLASFGGRLYAGTVNESGSGAQLWRTSDGFAWTDVLTNGFGAAYNVGIDHLFPFNGQLYAGTWADEVNGGEVYRSPDGLNWTPVVSGGFGDPTNAEIFRFAAFGGRLYASTLSYTDAHGGEIWRSASGDSGTWTRVVVNGFNGDANNGGIVAFETFNGYLYAGTFNSVTGGEVWRSSSGYGGAWKQVNQDGFGDVGNFAVTALAAFDGYLYAGTGHAAGGGAQVWRCQACNGSDWQRVVDNGFGNPDARATPALEAFDGYLYFVVGNTVTGLEVWRTQDGTQWEQVGYGGFGDSDNRQPYWDNSVTVFDNRLFVGTWNWVQGGQVWLYLHHNLYLPLLVQVAQRTNLWYDIAVSVGADGFCKQALVETLDGAVQLGARGRPGLQPHARRGLLRTRTRPPGTAPGRQRAGRSADPRPPAQTVSLPFAPGEHWRIAVKIVDDRGIESLKVMELEA